MKNKWRKKKGGKIEGIIYAVGPLPVLFIHGNWNLSYHQAHWRATEFFASVEQKSVHMDIIGNHIIWITNPRGIQISPRLYTYINAPRNSGQLVMLV